MQKLRLSFDELQVESFDASHAAGHSAGTVHAAENYCQEPLPY